MNFNSLTLRQSLIFPLLDSIKKRQFSSIKAHLSPPRWEKCNESSRDVVTSKLLFDVVALTTICHHLFTNNEAAKKVEELEWSVSELKRNIAPALGSDAMFIQISGHPNPSQSSSTSSHVCTHLIIANLCYARANTSDVVQIKAQ